MVEQVATERLVDPGIITAAEVAAVLVLLVATIICMLAAMAVMEPHLLFPVFLLFTLAVAVE
jgi:hypothetical protein